MRSQILSYGGGWQTVAMIVLVLRGILPRPDHIVIADTSREKSSTWDYLEDMVQPALERAGLRVAIASHDLATVDLYSGNGDLLIPVYTETGKLPTFCSSDFLLMKKAESIGPAVTRGNTFARSRCSILV